MNIFELMSSKEKSFSKNDNIIYHYIIKMPEMWANSSIKDILAALPDLSQPSLTRFAQKLGFSGFTEFQFQLKNDLQKQKNNVPVELASDKLTVLLKETELTTSKDQLNKIADRILNSSAVYLTGNHLSSLPANHLQMCLNITTSVPSAFLSLDNFTYVKRMTSTVIVYSAYSGDAFKARMQNISSFEKEAKPYTILITLNNSHPLAKYFDEVVVLPSVGANDSNFAVAAEPMTFLMFNKLLGEVLGEKQNEQES